MVFDPVLDAYNHAISKHITASFLPSSGSPLAQELSSEPRIPLSPSRMFASPSGRYPIFNQWQIWGPEAWRAGDGTCGVSIASSTTGARGHACSPPRRSHAHSRATVDMNGTAASVLLGRRTQLARTCKVQTREAGTKSVGRRCGMASCCDRGMGSGQPASDASMRSNVEERRVRHERPTMHGLGRFKSGHGSVRESIY